MARAVLEAADCRPNSRSRFKVKFRNAGFKFTRIEELENYFGSYGSVKNIHLEDEMPVDDENFDDGMVYIEYDELEQALDAAHQSISLHGLRVDMARECLTEQGLIKFGYRKRKLPKSQAEETREKIKKHELESSRPVCYENPFHDRPRPSSGDIGGCPLDSDHLSGSQQHGRPVADSLQACSSDKYHPEGVGIRQGSKGARSIQGGGHKVEHRSDGDAAGSSRSTVSGEVGNRIEMTGSSCSGDALGNSQAAREVPVVGNSNVDCKTYCSNRLDNDSADRSSLRSQADDSSPPDSKRRGSNGLESKMMCSSSLQSGGIGSDPSDSKVVCSDPSCCNMDGYNTSGSNKIGSKPLDSDVVGSNPSEINIVGSKSLDSNMGGRNPPDSKAVGSNPPDSIVVVSYPADSIDVVGSNPPDSNVVGSNSSESNAVGSNGVSINHSESYVAGSNPSESNAVGSNPPDSNTVGQNPPDSNPVGCNPSESNLVGGNSQDSIEVGTGSNPSESNTVSSNPSECNVVGSNPPDSNVVGSDPWESKTVGSKVLENNAVGSNPLDKNAVGSNHTDSNVVGSHPSESNENSGIQSDIKSVVFSSQTIDSGRVSTFNRTTYGQYNEPRPGADLWRCSFCSEENRGRSPSCIHCHENRRGWICQTCLNVTSPGCKVCPRCGQSRKAPPASRHPPASSWGRGGLCSQNRRLIDPGRRGGRFGRACPEHRAWGPDRQVADRRGPQEPNRHARFGNGSNSDTFGRHGQDFRRVGDADRGLRRHGDRQHEPTGSNNDHRWNSNNRHSSPFSPSPEKDGWHGEHRWHNHHRDSRRGDRRPQPNFGRHSQESCWECGELLTTAPLVGGQGTNRRQCADCLAETRKEVQEAEEEKRKAALARIGQLEENSGEARAASCSSSGAGASLFASGKHQVSDEDWTKTLRHKAEQQTKQHTEQSEQLIGDKSNCQNPRARPDQDRAMSEQSDSNSEWMLEQQKNAEQLETKRAKEAVAFQPIISRLLQLAGGYALPDQINSSAEVEVFGSGASSSSRKPGTTRPRANRFIDSEVVELSDSDKEDQTVDDDDHEEVAMELRRLDGASEQEQEVILKNFGIVVRHGLSSNRRGPEVEPEIIDIADEVDDDPDTELGLYSPLASSDVGAQDLVANSMVDSVIIDLSESPVDPSTDAGLEPPRPPSSNVNSPCDPPTGSVSPGHSATSASGSPGHSATSAPGSPGHSATTALGSLGHAVAAAPGSPGHSFVAAAPGVPCHPASSASGNPVHSTTAPGSRGHSAVGTACSSPCPNQLSGPDKPVPIAANIPEPSTTSPLIAFSTVRSATKAIDSCDNSVIIVDHPTESEAILISDSPPTDVVPLASPCAAIPVVTLCDVAPACR